MFVSIVESLEYFFRGLAILSLGMQWSTSQWLPVTTNRIMAFVSKGSQPKQTQSFPSYNWVVVSTHIFFNLHPGNLGKWSNLTFIFFKSVGEKPPTIDNSAKWDIWETVGACGGEKKSSMKIHPPRIFKHDNSKKKQATYLFEDVFILLTIKWHCWFSS